MASLVGCSPDIGESPAPPLPPAASPPVVTVLPPASVSTAPSVAKGDSLGGVDWAAAVEADCAVDVLDVVRGDANGDGRPDAVVVTTCKAVTSGFPDVVDVYDGASSAGRPRRVARVVGPETSGESRGSRYVSATVGPAGISVDVNEYAPSDINANPSLAVRYRFIARADGIALVARGPR